MTVWFARLVAVVGLVLTACTAPPTGTPTPPATPAIVRVATSDLGETLVADLVAGFHEAQRDVVVVVVPIAPDAAPPDLIVGADRGVSSAGFRTPLGGTTLVPVVASSFAAPEVSAAQLGALLSGAIADWSQVGGSAGSVVVVSRDSGAESAALIAERLGVAALVPEARLVPDWPTARLAIAQTPGALGLLPKAEITTDVRVLSAGPALTVTLEARASAEPSGPARAFLAWAQSPEGQGVVAKRHAALP